MQFDEYFNFIETNTIIPIFVLLLHLFYSYQLSCLLVYSFYDCSKAAVS